MHKGNTNSASHMFFLFLIFTPVSPQCELRSADECKVAHRVPGYDMMGVGFDVTTMKKTGQRVLNMSENKNPDGTCNLCYNDFVTGKPLQIIPLNVASWHRIHDCSGTTIATSHKSVISVASQEENQIAVNWTRGLGIGIPNLLSAKRIFAGSHSKIVRVSKQAGMKKNSVYIRHDIECGMYSVKIKDNPKIHADFKKAIDNLPEKYNCTTRPNYFRVIREFGTHVVNQFVLGGRISNLFIITMCEISMNELTVEEIRVCLAVLISQSAKIKLMEVSGEGYTQFCKTKQQQNAFKIKYKEITVIMHYETKGGNLVFGLSAARQQDTASVEKWLNSVNSDPYIISSKLIPIHTMVDTQDPRQRNLQKAVSDYITRRSLLVICKNICSSKTQPSPDEDCHCSCPEDKRTTAQCCSKQKYLGDMTVWVDHARGLYGDWYGKTDAFIEVKFQEKSKETEIMWDNDNPEFNVEYDFGAVQLIHMTNILRIFVKEWDPWAISLLGSCEFEVGAGEIQEKICQLKDGYVKVRYQVICGANLMGSQCKDFLPEAPTFSSISTDV